MGYDAKSVERVAEEAAARAGDVAKVHQHDAIEIAVAMTNAYKAVMDALTPPAKPVDQRPSNLIKPIHQQWDPYAKGAPAGQNIPIGLMQTEGIGLFERAQAQAVAEAQHAKKRADDAQCAFNASEKRADELAAAHADMQKKKLAADAQLHPKINAKSAIKAGEEMLTHAEVMREREAEANREIERRYQAGMQNSERAKAANAEGDRLAAELAGTLTFSPLAYLISNLQKWINDEKEDIERSKKAAQDAKANQAEYEKQVAIHKAKINGPAPKLRAGIWLDRHGSPLSQHLQNLYTYISAEARRQGVDLPANWIIGANGLIHFTECTAQQLTW